MGSWRQTHRRARVTGIGRKGGIDLYNGTRQSLSTIVRR